jgi:hypothetical protein
MASTPRAHLVSYTFGVFATYLAGGLVLVFAPGPALISALHRGQTERAAASACHVEATVWRGTLPSDQRGHMG